MKRTRSNKKSAIAGRKWRAKKANQAKRIDAARLSPSDTDAIPSDWNAPDGCMQYDIEPLRRKWLPRPKMKTLEWLEQNAVVPGGVGSDFKGKFNINYFPYQAGVLELFDDPEVREIYLQWGTQLGKTFLLQMLVPKIADTDPAPILFGAADADLAGNVGGRIYKIVEQVESLKGILPPEARRDMYKIGLGDCIVHMAWSGSPASLGDKSCRYVFCIELSKWNLKKSQEADPADLVRERVKMFFNTKIIMEGTPTVEGSCRMDALRQNATQRIRFQLPCPRCGKYIILAENQEDFINMKWDKNKEGKSDRDIATRTAYYQCTKCKGRIDNSEKITMMRAGVWAESGIDIPHGFKGKVYLTPGKYKDRVHLHLSSLYSPILSWGDCAGEFIRCVNKQRGTIGLQNFTNSWLANTWNPRTREYRWEDMKKYVLEKETIGKVPVGVKVLVCGIDTQDDALFYVVWGFGYDRETWLVDEGQLTCSMTTTNEDDLYSLVLGNIVNRVYLGSEDGREWKIAIGAWDSGGHRTKEVYSVCRRVRQLLPIKGRNHQPRRIMFSKADTHYNIRTEEYLEETEGVMETNKFHIPGNTSMEFMSHFVSKSKMKDLNKKTGAVSWKWTTRGADHLRMASAYAFACLDIPIAAIGTIRGNLSRKDFEMNPLRGHVKQESIGRRTDQPDAGDPFESHRRIGINKDKYGGFW